MLASQGTLSSEANPNRIFYPVLICLALAILTIITFGSLKDCGFINLDDNTYVYENAYVQSGLNWNNIGQAFSFSSELVERSSNWHPLTWLSLMLDYQIFGLNPQGYHLINLLFHVLNTILLFLILYRMTKKLWPSAFVACLFAIHPLHVESVAWISERKDVLSTFFWMLTIGAYSYYVEHPGFRRYFFVLLFFVLGLLAKPMLVTLPFVLLLLDYWPLQRFQEIKPGDSEYKWSLIYPLLREKIPLFVLIILSSIATYIVQQKGGAVHSEAFPLVVRIGNAFVSYIAYIGKMIWPGNLAVFYLHPGALLLWQVLGSVFLLIAITLVVIWKTKRTPYLATGWLWYLGTLVPVIGIVQVGSQSMADRYTYIPLIGLLIMIAWGVPDLLKKWKYQKEILLTLSALIILCFSIITWTQVGYWQNNITSHSHTLKVTNYNWPIYICRGIAYADLGNYRQAIDDYSQAIELKPDYAEVYNYRGKAYYGLSNYRQTIDDYGKAIELKPDYTEAYINRGAVYLKQGDNIAGCRDAQKACELGNCKLLEMAKGKGDCR
jgi:protein O-mannosyl-transferase